MFDTTLATEYRLAHEVLGIDREGLLAIARTGISSSFADRTRKQQLRAELDAFAATS